jgi:hypothetical protein
MHACGDDLRDELPWKPDVNLLSGLPVIYLPVSSSSPAAGHGCAPAAALVHTPSCFSIFVEISGTSEGKNLDTWSLVRGGMTLAVVLRTGVRRALGREVGRMRGLCCLCPARSRGLAPTVSPTR